MPVQWFCRTDKKEVGPISSKQLIRLARAGHLTVDSAVRKGDNGKWVRAEMVNGLFDSETTTTKTEKTNVTEETYQCVECGKDGLSLEHVVKHKLGYWVCERCHISGSGFRSIAQRTQNKLSWMGGKSNSKKDVRIALGFLGFFSGMYIGYTLALFIAAFIVLVFYGTFAVISIIGGISGLVIGVTIGRRRNIEVRNLFLKTCALWLACAVLWIGTEYILQPFLARKLIKKYAAQKTPKTIAISKTSDGAYTASFTTFGGFGNSRHSISVTPGMTLFLLPIKMWKTEKSFSRSD